MSKNSRPFNSPVENQVYRTLIPMEKVARVPTVGHVTKDCYGQNLREGDRVQVMLTKGAKYKKCLPIYGTVLEVHNACEVTVEFDGGAVTRSRKIDLRDVSVGKVF